jgi:thiol-disulfide isomerase/thioredoxin
MKKILIGKVYAKWCGHCQTLEPEWLKMKKDLKSKMKKMGYLIEFVEIEESQKNNLAKFKKSYPDLKVSGYPTIFKSSGGSHLEYYQGERVAQKMGGWALGQNNVTMGGKKRKTAKSKTSKNKRKTAKSKTSKNKRKTAKNKTMISRITSLFDFGKK